MSKNKKKKTLNTVFEIISDSSVHHFQLIYHSWAEKSDFLKVLQNKIYDVLLQLNTQQFTRCLNAKSSLSKWRF